MMRLERLSALILEIPPFNSLNVQACVLAGESLKEIYATCDESPNGRRRMWLWPFTLPQEFLNLLASGHPVALIILAYFAAMVKCLEGWHWNRRGWSKNIIHMVERTLDERWKEWLDWPMQCIFEGLGVNLVTRLTTSRS